MPQFFLGIIINTAMLSAAKATLIIPPRLRKAINNACFYA